MLVAVMVLGGTSFAGYQATSSPRAVDVEMTSGEDITVQNHDGPRRRCKPKGKYGKPPPPRKCRRRPHRP